MYTETEREKIGREIYEGKYTVVTAATRYAIGFYTARTYLRTYKAALAARQYLSAEAIPAKTGRGAYSKTKREEIGREIYEKKYTVAAAAARYNISFYVARNYLRFYKKRHDPQIKKVIGKNNNTQNAQNYDTMIVSNKNSMEDIKMTKADFISVIAEKSGCTKKDADAVMKAFSETLLDVVKNGGSLMLAGIGTFSVIDKPERTGRNPRTGETTVIPAHKSPKFKFATVLKNAAKGE